MTDSLCHNNILMSYNLGNILPMSAFFNDLEMMGHSHCSGQEYVIQEYHLVPYHCSTLPFDHILFLLFLQFLI